MKKLIATLLITVLLGILTCSLAYSASGDIWLAGYHLLTLKTPDNAKAFEKRVDTVQLRANDLLALNDKLPKISVRKYRGETSIFTDNKIFLTVTKADARVSGKTIAKLASYWAQRLRTILPDATPIKH